MGTLDRDNLRLLGVEMLQIPDFIEGRVQISYNGSVERSSKGGRQWGRQCNYVFSEYVSVHESTANYFLRSFDLEVVDSQTAWVGIYNSLLKTENGGWN